MDYKKKYKETIDKIRELQWRHRFSPVSDDIEETFHELKESEDERIRKALITLLQHFCKGYRVPGLDFPVSYKDMLSWLEKQDEKKETLCDKCKKEQPSHSCQDITELGRCAVEHGQKPAECSEDEKIISRIKKAVESYWSDEPLDEILDWLEKQGDKDEEILILKDQIESLHAAIKAIKETHRIELEKQGEHVSFLNKIQVGDKVTRNQDGVLVNLSQLNRVAKQGKQKPYGQREECWDCQMNYAGVCKGYCGLKRNEQKSDKWSEEDSKWAEEIRLALRFYSKDELFVERLTNWFDNHVQPKQEWSEEDETNASYICVSLDRYYRLRKERNNTSGQENLDKARNWLYNRLKSLRPQSHWKPSDEQMEALANALSLAKNCGEETAFDLRTLYEQLKKLREE